MDLSNRSYWNGLRKKLQNANQKECRIEKVILKNAVNFKLSEKNMKTRLIERLKKDVA